MWVVGGRRRRQTDHDGMSLQWFNDSMMSYGFGIEGQ